MPLFTTIGELAAHFPVLESTSYEHLRSFLILQERKVIRDQVLGRTLYASLLAAYEASIADSPTPLSSAMADLLEAVRTPLAHLVMHDASPTLNVAHSSGGMQVNETATSKPAHMWRVRDAQAAMLKQAYGHLGLLIDFLQENASTYPAWTEAPVYKELRESLVPRLEDAQRHVKPATSWLLHHLRPAMRKVQRGQVKTILGDTAYTELLTAVHAGTLTDSQRDRLDLIQGAIMHMALADQIVQLSLEIDSDGVWNWKAVSSGSAVSGGKQPVTDQRLNAKVREHQLEGQRLLNELKDLVSPEQPSTGFPGFNAGGVFFGG